MSRKPVSNSRALVVFALFAVLLLGGGLRFYGLGIQSLWVDELASVWFSEPDQAGEVVERTRGDVHPPGYYLVLHFTRELLGDGDVAIRLPSALAGTLSVFAMYLLGRRLYSSREGLAAALFSAVFFAPVYYSQEARSYSMLLLFAILTAFFWWGVFSKLRHGERPSISEMLGYVGSAVACCYLHYFGLYLVALQGTALFTLFLFQPRNLLWTLAVYLPVVAAYLPWLPAMSGQFRERPTGATPVAEYVDFLFNHSTAMRLVAGSLLILSLLSSMGNFALAMKKKDLGPLLPGGLLVAWAVLPFAFAYIISETYSPILSARNMIIALPAVYLLLARATTHVFVGRGPRLAVIFGLAAMSLSQLFFVEEYYSRQHKQQVREAVGFVTARAASDPLVVHCGVGREANHYYEQQGTDRSEIAHVGACAADRIDAIKTAVEDGNHQSVILVNAHLRPEEELLEALKNEFELVEHKDFVEAGARLYAVE